MALERVIVNERELKLPFPSISSLFDTVMTGGASSLAIAALALRVPEVATAAFKPTTMRVEPRIASRMSATLAEGRRDFKRATVPVT